MTNTSQWELFGFDLRRLGQFLTQAWTEVFTAYNAPVRSKLDVPVTVYRWEDEQAPVLPSEAPSSPSAIILPEKSVLKRELVLPRSAKANLSHIVAAEIEASSPFRTSEIAVGTSIRPLPNKKISIQLAIVSRSGVMQLLHGLNENIAPDDYEVWAEHNGEAIVLEGFGEALRNKLYRKRLAVFTGNMVVSVAALLLLLALPFMYQNERLDNVRELLDVSRQQASAAMRHRNSLVEDNAHLSVIQRQAELGAKPLEPLRALSSQIDTNAWLGSYEQQHNVITVDGFSANAAALIQQLTAQEHFSEVKPVSAIRKLARDQVERFRLELHFVSLAGEENE